MPIAAPTASPPATGIDGRIEERHHHRERHADDGEHVAPARGGWVTQPLEAEDEQNRSDEVDQREQIAGSGRPRSVCTMRFHDR